MTITLGTSAYQPVPPLNSSSLSFFSIGTLQFQRQDGVIVDCDDYDDDHHHLDDHQENDDDDVFQDATDDQRRSVNPRLQVSFKSLFSLHITSQTLLYTSYVIK